MSAKYIFKPTVTEQEWLGPQGQDGWAAWRSMPRLDRWAVWRSMPHRRDFDALDRKRLMLVAHLLREVADQMTDPRFVAVIEAGEKGADGLISKDEMWAAQQRAYELFDTVRQPHEAAQDAALVAQWYIYEQNETAEWMVGAAGSRAARLAGRKGKKAEAARRKAEEDMEALIRRLINEVHGNPFRPVTLHPSWLTPTITSLAQAIYEDRQLPSGLFDNQRMGVLADALEEAGCDNTDILGHLRASGEHVRGCWAIDLLLGKG
jgi:hypothetical protein